MDRRGFIRNATRIILAALFPGWRTTSAGQNPNHPAGPLDQRRGPTSAGILNIRDFGAAGDGQRNDTHAFQAASAEINRRGGGVLYIPGGTYLVGMQTFADGSGKGYAYRPAPIVAIAHCTRPVVIIGAAGARLRAADGLKFGAYDPLTGKPDTPAGQPIKSADHTANAYVMLRLENNIDVSVANLELDGNLQGLALGSEWGDAGRQLDATGILATGNRHLTIRHVHSHHHGLDGIYIGYPGLKPDSTPTPVVLDRVVSEYNARQGLSWVGGIGLSATHCRFNHTGSAGLSSPPTAGVDIEAQDSVVRNGFFSHCEFSDNKGCGILADSGDSAQLTFDHCTVWGSRTWSLWPHKPGMTFRHCNIHGALSNIYSEAGRPSAACRFLDCTLDDDAHPRYGPSYTGSGKILIDMGGAPGFGVTFDGCTITARHSKSLFTMHPGPQDPITLKNTVITHGWGFPKTKDFLCLLEGVYLENVHFKEVFAARSPNRYHILIRRSTIGANVWVDGPAVSMTAAPGIGRITPRVV